MDTKNIITSLIISVVVVALGLFVYSPDQVTIDRTITEYIENNSDFGFRADYPGELFVGGAFSQGGQIFATTSAASATLNASDLLEYDILDITPSTAVTITLPATTSWTGPSLIDDAGDYRTWVIRNASSDNVTLAAGTGVDLQEPDGQNVVIGQNNYAWMTCYRQADPRVGVRGDITCRVDETIPAD